MSIDERIEAMTHTLELHVQMQQEHERRTQEHERRTQEQADQTMRQFGQVLEMISRLERIVTLHEAQHERHDEQFVEVMRKMDGLIDALRRGSNGSGYPA